MKEDSSPKRVKRAKACDNCRSLKVRCIPSDPNDPNSPCVRCVKFNKKCTIRPEVRRKTKKTAKVVDLERKVQMLTAALNKRTPPYYPHDWNQQPDHSVTDSAKFPHKDDSVWSATASSRSPLDGPDTGESSTRHDLVANDTLNDSLDNSTCASHSPPDLEINIVNGDVKVNTGVDMEAMKEEMVLSWNELTQRFAAKMNYYSKPDPRLPRLPRTPTYETDVVSLNIITAENARHRLEFFKSSIFKKYPIIALGDQTVEEMRRSCPKLFLTIMAISSISITDPCQMEASNILQNHAYDAVVHETMILGSKTYELIQCIMLLVFWYNEPDFYHHHKSDLLINIAVGLATDLGINGILASTRLTGSKIEKLATPNILHDPTAIECRNLWLIIYSSVVTMVNLRKRPVFHLWTAYTRDCCDVILNSDIEPRRKASAIFAKVARILEEISTSLYGNTVGSRIPPSFEDSRTIHLMKYFESELSDVMDLAKKYRLENEFSFQTQVNFVKIQLYQLVLHVPFNDALGRSPFTDYSLAVWCKDWNPDAIMYLTSCFESCYTSLLSYREYTPLEMCVMPLFDYARMVFAVSVLLKLRILSLLNPRIKKVCQIRQKHVDTIVEIIGKLNHISQKYQFCNSCICFNFLIKLLMCHFDQRTKSYLLQEKQFNDKSNAPTPVIQAQVGYSETEKTARDSAPALKPSSPLDILSNVASQADLTDTRQPSPILENAATDPAKGLVDVDDLWLTGDEFWRDSLPALDGLNGFDLQSLI